MSRISKMKLKDILDQTDIMLRDTDIGYFCDNIEIIKKFMNRYKFGTNDRKEVKQFLIEHEEYIDKEKLILLTVKNYIENIKILKDYIESLKEQYSMNQSQEQFKQIAGMHIQLHQQEDNLVTALNLGKGIDTVFSVYNYDEAEGRYIVEAIDSREWIDGKTLNYAKEARKFDKIDSNFRDEKSKDGLGLEFVLQSMLLTDLYHIFPDEHFGNDIRTMILENEILKRGMKTKDELEGLKTKEPYDEYVELIDNINFVELLPTVKATLREYALYIDMDKVLLTSAYRFQEALENGEVSPKMHSMVKELMGIIVNSIKNNDAQLCCNLQDKRTYNPKEVRYSVEDINKCLSQFANDKYLTREEIQEYKEKANNGEISLQDISPESIDVIFSNDELEKLSTLSKDNLMYVFNKYNWDASKIIELYEANKIPLEYLKQIKYVIDLSEGVNFERLNSYYNQYKEKQEDEENLARYDNYLKLYKEIYVNDKEKGRIQENSSIVIEKLAETLDEEEYKETVKKYYLDGIITLDSIVEWSNANLITNMFNEGIITLEDIRSVGVALGYDYLQNLYTDLVYRDDIEYDKRIEYIESGMVEAEDVITLYNNGLIMDEDLIKLAEKALLPLEIARQTIDNRQLEDRIKTARAKALGWSDSNLLFHIDGIEKKHTDGILYTNIFNEGIRKEKLIIDPNIRQKYIEMLGLYRIETECSYDNPFYNYEFYATPDETGAIGANSVIIAERYYTNKVDEKNFATNNATYFFKYKDFLVLSNLQKKDMIKERENIVFRTNHTISTNGKRGTWAENVLHNVLKTMLGSDLSNLSKKEKRTKIIEKMTQMYLKEECEEILKLCEEIDSGEYICNAQGIQYGKSKNIVSPNFDDDNDAR